MELFADFNSKMILVAALLTIGYLYLLVTDTETAIRILFNVFSFLGKALWAVAKGIYNLVDNILKRFMK